MSGPHPIFAGILAAHGCPLPEPRYCRDCDDDQVGTALLCPFCDARTITIADRDQAAWERQQEEWASEPPVSADEAYQRAVEQRRELRS